MAERAMTTKNTHIDSQMVAKNFAKAYLSYDKNAIIQQKICQELIQRLPNISPSSVLEIGCGTGSLTNLYAQRWQLDKLYLSDLHDSVKDNLVYCPTEYLIGNIEHLPLPKIDVVLSSSALQWIKNLPSLMARIHHALHDGGIFAFSSFGMDNLKEIRSLTGKGLDYHALDDIKFMLKQAGFKVMYACQRYHTLNFTHPKDVLHHIKDTGVSVGGGVWNKSSLQTFYDDYHQRFAIHQEGKENRWLYPLTYDALILVAKKAHQLHQS
ncbi:MULTISPECIES: methyltransferase domain-containing protein [unclassified Moraxella]|uniref:methyltransferase domain-containing protein n=1 Tax=unclassified Moraxella TaxID=2685852 RepID=UPI002B40558C|nr:MULTISPECIES: methyltransferase domain-containing protein [unclassified Moraxella]